MWAVPGLPIHPSSVQQHNQPHPAATAAAAMLSSCYDAVSSDLSPLKKKKLSSILINRDTPILRTVLGQGQADSSQPVSLVCHPDSHDSRGSESSEHHRMEKVSFINKSKFPLAMDVLLPLLTIISDKSQKFFQHAFDYQANRQINLCY